MGKNRHRAKNKPPRPKGPDPRDSTPLPTKEVDGEQHYDLEKMNLYERVRFLLWKTQDQERMLLAMQTTLEKHRQGLLDAIELTHVVAALVRREFPLVSADGAPVLDQFLASVARESEAFTSAFMPGLDPVTKAALEARSVSHRIQRCTKAARQKSIEAIKAARKAAEVATAPTINPTPSATKTTSPEGE